MELHNPLGIVYINYILHVLLCYWNFVKLQHPNSVMLLEFHNIASVLLCYIKVNVLLHITSITLWASVTLPKFYYVNKIPLH